MLISLLNLVSITHYSIYRMIKLLRKPPIVGNALLKKFSNCKQNDCSDLNIKIPLIQNKSVRNERHTKMVFKVDKYGFCTAKKVQSTVVQELRTLVKQQSSSNCSQTDQSPLPSVITKMKSYSNFLKNKNQGAKSLELGFGSKEQFLSQVNQCFAQAGTTVDQISGSLQSLSNDLQTMLTNSYKQQKYHQYSSADKKQIDKNWLFELLNNLDKKIFELSQPHQLTAIEVSLFLLNLETKMTCLVALLKGTIESKQRSEFKQDITSVNPFSTDYDYAWRNAEEVVSDETTKTRHDFVYSLLEKSVVMVTNAVVNQHTISKWDNQLWRKTVFGLSFPISITNLQKAELKCYRMWRNPKIQMVKNLLDLPQKGMIQHAKKVIYPHIKSNFFLYAPQSKNNTKGEQSKGTETSHNIFQQAKNSRRILLLSHQNLQFKKLKPRKSFYDIASLFETEPDVSKSVEQAKTIIIHIHGGGFISMSSELMQNHTRKWAKQLGIPVFSLDYRKPPFHRFPEPLEDCVSGYKFIVERINEYLSIKPENIILAGDSAGGNLACAIQIQLMKEKYPILPKGMLLMYPAVDLRIRYTPSRLKSFEDKIFQPSLLLLCQQQYLGKNSENQFDPLASPILLTEKYLDPSKSGPSSEEWPRGWPSTVILSGGKDPLYDDSARLLERLSKSNIDCRMRYYKNLSHGFMSMDQVLPGCKQAIDDSITQLRQMISKF